MKRLICVILMLTLLLAGCNTAPAVPTQPDASDPAAQSSGQSPAEGEIRITLSDDGVLVDGAPAGDSGAVFTANDIVYYEAGHDFTYGEGEAGDEHDAAEAQAHTVVHITRPGTYRITGKLSAGQIAVDLGEDAKDDPNAVVTLVLDGVDITCTVAPAVIFYEVYECCEADEETAAATVDTSGAGANVVLAEGSTNLVSGSYVARIYKEGTVVLNEDGTGVEDAKKLHKYDAAFYSKMSMNISGGGSLRIEAENEGLDSELHLTINGGDISIRSGNDGINTNEDNVSVTTVNGGNLTITVTGTTGEGDGIDSNGYLVINGGTVHAFACGFSGDAGIDSDLGIYLNGGTVVASGNMLDTIAGGESTYAVFQFSGSQKGGSVYALKNEAGETVVECAPANDFSCLILAGEALQPGTYTLWLGDTVLSGTQGGRFFGDHVGQLPGRLDIEPPEGEYEIPPQPTMPVTPQGGQMPGGERNPQDSGQPQMPDGETRPDMGQTPPEGEFEPGMGQMTPGGGPGNFGGMTGGELSAELVIAEGGNYFTMSASTGAGEFVRE